MATASSVQPRLDHMYDVWLGGIWCDGSIRHALDEALALELPPGALLRSLTLVRTGSAYWWPSLEVA